MSDRRPVAVNLRYRLLRHTANITARRLTDWAVAGSGNMAVAKAAWRANRPTAPVGQVWEHKT